ncbi:MAG: dTDP-glucose 4,6-dehydratase [Promethearchaeota archaeon]
MVFLITGGAGFIGRWVVKELLEIGKDLVIIDNLENGSMDNLFEFKNNSNLKEIIVDDIINKRVIERIFNRYQFECCIHLAAQINVQESLENPGKSFNSNILGTFNILEVARKYNTKIILISTCMVYDFANSELPISEEHPVNPLSPYAASKLAAEYLALSYFYSYSLPIVILRPFNTYGPFQKTNMEGGVVSIFVKRALNNEDIFVFGSGNQTRDFLYVEDCADFIVKATENEECIGEIINAGLGMDISINDLAKLIVKNDKKIKHVDHHHPQCEIKKLLCDNSKAKKILKWAPKTSLLEGIEKLKFWLKNNNIGY